MGTPAQRRRSRIVLNKDDDNERTIPTPNYTQPIDAVLNGDGVVDVMIHRKH